MKYFQSLPNENNVAFDKAFKEMWGDDIVIGDVTRLPTSVPGSGNTRLRKPVHLISTS